MTVEDLDEVRRTNFEERKLIELEIKELNELKNNAAFEKYLEGLQEQLNLRRDFYELDNATGLDVAVAGEFRRGEIAALRLALEYTKRREEELQVRRETIGAIISKIDSMETDTQEGDM